MTYLSKTQDEAYHSLKMDGIAKPSWDQIFQRERELAADPGRLADAREALRAACGDAPRPKAPCKHSFGLAGGFSKCPSCGRGAVKA
jgi:hypothetical protein